MNPHAITSVVPSFTCIVKKRAYISEFTHWILRQQDEAGYQIPFKEAIVSVEVLEV